MRFHLFYISLIFTAKNLVCQPACVVNGSINTISSICIGQSTSLNTNSLNLNCYTLYEFPNNFMNGLVSYYPFCGNSYDENSHNSDLGAVQSVLTTDRFGNPLRAYDFNGTTSYLQGGAYGFPIGNSARTITLWFYDRVSLSTGPDSIASNLFCYGNNITNGFFQILHMSPSNGGNIKIDFMGSSITTSVGAGFNSWQFFAFTLDAASNYTTYINSNIVGTGTININTASLNMHLGMSNLAWPAPKYYLNGKMDEIFIYSRDLSQSEITQLYTINTLPTTYSWSTGATTNSIAVSPTTTSIYTLSATNGFYSCTASSTVAVSPCTGIEELSNNSTVQLYPNPTTGNLQIHSEKNFDKASEIIITNYLGQTVFEIPFQNEINVSQLSRGFYSLKIISAEKEIYRTKFIKD